MDPVRVIAWIFLAALGIPLFFIAVMACLYVTLAIAAGVSGG
jgi:hypothetical protein